MAGRGGDITCLATRKLVAVEEATRSAWLLVKLQGVCQQLKSCGRPFLSVSYAKRSPVGSKVMPLATHLLPLVHYYLLFLLTTNYYCSFTIIISVF
jgi:hypothetical protein